MAGTLIALSSALAALSLWLLTRVPAGHALFSVAASLMLLTGAAGFVAGRAKGRGRDLPLSAGRKTALSSLSLLVILSGIALTLLSAAGAIGGPEPSFLLAFFFSVTLAGAVLLLLPVDTHEHAGREGFYFTPGDKYVRRWGRSGPRYVFRGEKMGVPLTASISTGVVDRGGEPLFSVDVTCLIDNPGGAELLAYPLGAKSGRFTSRLPEIRRLAYWEHYMVRGRPAPLIAAILPPFRKSMATIFSEAYGFERLSVSGNRTRGRFVLRGAGEKYRVNELVDRFVFFSGHFN